MCGLERSISVEHKKHKVLNFNGKLFFFFWSQADPAVFDRYVLEGSSI